MGFPEIHEADKWLDTMLNDESAGIRRIAARNLRKSDAGRIHLKRLYREQPQHIIDLYFFIPWDCIDKLAKLPIEPPEIDKTGYYPFAFACPICDTPPARLRWVFMHSHNLLRECSVTKNFKRDGWYSYCDPCQLQLDFFDIDHTPEDMQE